MPRDLFLMPALQLQNLKSLLLQDAQCPDIPPMSSLTYLRMSCEPAATQTMLPLPSLPMLEVLTLDGVGSCPSLSCLHRLTRLSLTGRYLSGPAVYPASAHILQIIKVCHACSSLFLCTGAFA